MFLAGHLCNIASSALLVDGSRRNFLGRATLCVYAAPETRAWLLFGIVINVVIFSWVPAALGAVSVFLVYTNSRSAQIMHNVTTCAASKLIRLQFEHEDRNGFI